MVVVQKGHVHSPTPTVVIVQRIIQNINKQKKEEDAAIVLLPTHTKKNESSKSKGVIALIVVEMSPFLEQTLFFGLLSRVRFFCSTNWSYQGTTSNLIIRSDWSDREEGVNRVNRQLFFSYFFGCSLERWSKPAFDWVDRSWREVRWNGGSYIHLTKGVQDQLGNQDAANDTYGRVNLANTWR